MMLFLILSCFLDQTLSFSKLFFELKILSQMLLYKFFEFEKKNKLNLETSFNNFNLSFIHIFTYNDQDFYELSVSMSFLFLFFSS